MRRILYFDNAATTPVDPRVVEAMVACLGPEHDFANPASAHALGTRARQLVERARAAVGARVNAPPARIAFMSGATEANNLALKGALRARGAERKHLVTTRIEHKSILESARTLERDGVAVTYLECDAQGNVTPEQVDAAITEATVLVSVMHVNNEVGVIENIPEIARVCRARGVLLHVDAAQSAGKIPLDVAGWGIDLCSLTAHKINGPKGIGALYVRSGIALAPLVDGGEPEIGLRGGTLATHQIVGMGRAFELADPDVEGTRLAQLREELWLGLEALGGVTRNGNPKRCAPHILSVSLRGVDGASLLFALPDIALSQGSACNSSVPEPSYVLTALGLSDAVAQSTLRFGLGRFTESADVAYALERVGAEFNRLRALARGAPAWCSS
ncbi:MAG TPA: cysteine desulfurase family protein [Gammaproteobacteria bacterium]|jgi:cysteine desulfurase